jgi:phospholipase/carboxylesterase
LLRVYVLHCRVYDFVLPSMGRAAHDWLAERCINVAWEEYPMAHEVLPGEIHDIGTWLSERLSE